MTTPRSSDGVLQFGTLTVDPKAKEAWQDGKKLSLQLQPFQILEALMERPGEIVTREVLQKLLWPQGTFVDFDHSLNTAVKKLRQALGDSAEEPRFVETLPRIGYRLVSAPPGPVSRSGRRAWWGVVFAGVALAVMAAISARVMRDGSGIVTDTSGMKFTRVTALGTVVQAVLSKDGRFVSFTVSDRGLQTLWLQRIGSDAAIQLTAPTDKQLWSSQFTPDGKFLYYVVLDPYTAEKTLYRISVLDVEPYEILRGIDSGKVAFSPDGKRMAYLRAGYPTPGESAVVVANADGSEPKIIATRGTPEFFAPIYFNSPSWSPDGKWIATGAMRRPTGVEQVGELIVMRPDGSGQRRISDDRWVFIGQSEWLPDASGLLVVAAGRPPFDRPQLWFLPFPRGEPKRITNDFLWYRSVSLSADGSSLITVATETESFIWKVDLEQRTRPVRLTQIRNDGFFGVAAAPDDEVVYTGSRNQRLDTFRTGAGGTSRIPLLDETSQGHPAVSSRGELAFDVPGGGIYLAALDGSRIRRLTDGAFPAFTPDGGSVIFEKGSLGLFRIGVEGGKAARLTDYPAFNPAVSPDGELIAATCFTEGPRRLCVIPIEGGDPVKEFGYDPPSFDEIQWMPDGSGILGVGTDDQANIYLRPLDGSAQRRITDLEELQIFTFAVSQDGRSIYLTRGRLSRDAVLITGFHSPDDDG